METLAVIVATLLVALIVSNLSSGEKTIDYEIAHRYDVADDEFVRSMGTLLGPAILHGNHTTALYNGDQIFPAMLGAIRGARRTITFETYIYWSGAIGKEFGDALSERARAGVKVHVLLDWVGSGRMDSSILHEMEEAGAQVVKYHPPRWYRLGRFNNRTHRKLLVIDGKVGFTGGVGIADVWSGNAQDPDHWRDSHFKLEGPAVAQMQAAFVDNWIETRALVLHGEEYFPALEPAGSQAAQVFKSSATDGSETIRLMYLLSLSCATKSIRIGNAYFVPDDLAVDTLVAARKRGVTVEIIVPGRHADTEVVRNASRSRWGPLLEAGVAIYEYQPTMYHTKVMVVDDLWTSVGSTNFDNRSFRLNAEANLNILDSAFALGEVAAFERDKVKSRRITLEMWRSRPWPNKVKDWFAGLFRLQL